MPYSWQLLDDVRLGFGRLSGTLTGEEMLAAADEFCSDEDWQPGDRLLWDNRWITKLAISQKDVGRILRRSRDVARHLGDSRAAAVVSPDLLTMSEHLVFMAGMAPDKVRVFSSLEAATRWLDVPLEALPEESRGRAPRPPAALDLPAPTFM